MMQFYSKRMSLIKNRNVAAYSSIEDNIHYKRIKKLKPENLTRVKNNIIHINNNKVYSIIKKLREDESIYVFQDIEKNKGSIFLFENKDDADIFATQLEAEIESSVYGETVPLSVEVNGLHIIELCKENGFDCFFHTTGSLITPMNMDI